NDAAVRGSQMLQAVSGDALMDAHLSVVVAGDTLPLRIGPLPVLPEAGILPQCTPLRSPPEANLHHVGIVDGDRPCGGRRPIDGSALCHWVGIGRKLVDIGGIKSATRTQTLSPCRRVSIYTIPAVVSMKSHSPSAARSPVNPSLPGRVWRKARCAGSILLSFTCSQLHGQILPGRATSWYPGTSNVSRRGKAGCRSGGP